MSDRYTVTDRAPWGTITVLTTDDFDEARRVALESSSRGIYSHALGMWVWPKGMLDAAAFAPEAEAA